MHINQNPTSLPDADSQEPQGIDLAKRGIDPSNHLTPTTQNEQSDSLGLVIETDTSSINPNEPEVQRLDKIIEALAIIHGTGPAAMNRANRRNVLAKIKHDLKTSHGKKSKPRRNRSPLPFMQKMLDDGDWELFESYSEDSAGITILRAVSHRGDGCIVSRISTPAGKGGGQALLSQFGDTHRAAMGYSQPIGIGWLVFAHNCSARVGFYDRVDYRAILNLIEKHGIRVVLWNEVSRLARNVTACTLLIDHFTRHGVLPFVNEVGGLIQPEDDDTKQLLLGLLCKVSEINGNKIASGAKGATWARRMLLGIGDWSPPPTGLRRGFDEYLEVDPDTYPVCRFIALSFYELHRSNAPAETISHLYQRELGFECSPLQIEAILGEFGSPHDAKILVRLLAEAGYQLGEKAVRAILVRPAYTTGTWFATIEGDLKMAMELVRNLDHPVPQPVLLANIAALDANTSMLKHRELCEATIHDRTWCGYCGAKFETGVDADGNWYLRHKPAKGAKCLVEHFVALGDCIENVVNIILLALERDPALRQYCFDLMAEERDEAVARAFIDAGRARIDLEISNDSRLYSELFSNFVGQIQAAAHRGVNVDQDFQVKVQRDLGLDELMARIGRLHEDRKRFDDYESGAVTVPLVRSFRDNTESSKVILDILGKPLDELTPDEWVLRYFIVRRCVSGLVLAPNGDPRSGSTDVVVLGSLGPLGERLERPVSPSQLVGDLIGNPLRRVSEAIPSETRRSVNAMYPNAPESAIGHLIKQFGAVREIECNGVPDWMWIGELSTGQGGIRWANRVSGWEVQDDTNVHGAASDVNTDLSDQHGKQRGTEYSMLAEERDGEGNEPPRLFR